MLFFLDSITFKELFINYTIDHEGKLVEKKNSNLDEN